MDRAKYGVDISNAMAIIGQLAMYGYALNVNWNCALNNELHSTDFSIPAMTVLLVDFTGKMCILAPNTKKKEKKKQTCIQREVQVWMEKIDSESDFSFSLVNNMKITANAFPVKWSSTWIILKFTLELFSEMKLTTKIALKRDTIFFYFPNWYKNIICVHLSYMKSIDNTSL